MVETSRRSKINNVRAESKEASVDKNRCNLSCFPPVPSTLYPGPDERQLLAGQFNNLVIGSKAQGVELDCVGRRIESRSLEDQKGKIVASFGKPKD